MLTPNEIETLRTARPWLRRIDLESAEGNIKCFDGIQCDQIDETMRKLDPIIAKLEGSTQLSRPGISEYIPVGRTAEREEWREADRHK